MLILQVVGGNAVQPATQRDRLAAVDGELVVLQAQYELAMSGSKFDEASALQRKIAVLESEGARSPLPCRLRRPSRTGRWVSCRCCIGRGRGASGAVASPKQVRPPTGHG